MRLDNASGSRTKTGLPLILLAGVVQGWALYGLHLALQEHHWPATEPTWLSALYALAVFSGALPTPLQGGGEYFSLGFLLMFLWLLALPFAQGRLATGGWEIRYESLFTNVWRNKLMLAEAVLFTGRKAISATWLLWLTAVSV